MALTNKDPAAAFREGQTGYLEFPAMHPDVLSDVITFMYHAWYRRSRQRKKAAHEGRRQSDDVSAPKFEPSTTQILELLDAAVYLDLPELADKCADVAARLMEDIESFGDLAAPLIRSILKRTSIGDLCLAEAKLIIRTRNQTCADEDMPAVDTRSLWERNYLCLLPQFTPTEKSRALVLKSALYDTKSDRFRSQCISYFSEQFLSAGSSHQGLTKLCQLFQLEGHNITTLNIALDNNLTNLWIALIDCARQCLPCLGKVEVTLADGTDDWGLLVGSLRNTACKLVSVRSCTPFNADIGEMPGLIAHALAHEGRAHKTDTAVRHELNIASDRNLSVRLRQKEGARASPQKMDQSNSGKGMELVVECRPAKSSFTISRDGLTEGLAHILNFCAFTELNLSGCAITLEGLEAISTVLHSNQLRSLKLAGCSVGSDGITFLVTNLIKNRTLRTLDISSNISATDLNGSDSARAISQMCKSATSALRNINISHNHFTTVGLLALCTALAENTHIDIINMTGLEIGSLMRDLVEKVSSGENFCRRYKLGRNKLLPRAIIDVFGLLQNWTGKQGRAITHLDLAGNFIDENSGLSIAAALKSRACRLVELVLDATSEDFIIGDVGAAAIFSSLEGNYLLKHLSLCNHGISTDGFMALVQVLGKCGLEEVMLRANFVDDDGVNALQKKLGTVRVGGGVKRVAVDLESNRVSKRLVQQLRASMFAVDGHVLYVT